MFSYVDSSIRMRLEGEGLLVTLDREGGTVAEANFEKFASFNAGQPENSSSSIVPAGKRCRWAPVMAPRNDSGVTSVNSGRALTRSMSHARTALSLGSLWRRSAPSELMQINRARLGV